MSDNQKIKQPKKIDTEEELKQIVIQRLKTSSDELQVVIGGEGNFTNQELIESIEAGDKIGQEILESEIEFIKAIAQGKIYSQ